MSSRQEWREIMPNYMEPVRETGAGINRGILEEIKDYRKYRDRLYFRLINTERNRGLLEKAPHEKIMDLSMVCYVLISDTDNGIASIMVTGRLAEYWGVSADEIMAQAIGNTPKVFPARVQDMLSVLKEAAAAGNTEMPVWEEGKPCLHVLSNSRGIDGFSAVLYPGVLKGFADAQGKDLYVLPSSRHEALLLPDDGNLDVEELRGMVRQVNDTEVAGEDILSYRVYFYGRGKNELKITGEEEKCVKL